MDNDAGMRWKVNKALYGQADAGARWRSALSEALIAKGYHECPLDPCVWLKTTDGANRTVLFGAGGRHHGMEHRLEDDD